MDVFRLRPNALKTPTGGGFYGHGSNQQRKSIRVKKATTRNQSSEYSPNSSYTTTQLLIPPSESAPSPSFDDISINSSEFRNLLWDEGGRRQNTYELLKHQQQRSGAAMTSTIDPPDSKDILASSFVLPKIGGYDNTRRPITRELSIQTKRRILLREYLPQVKDHKIWRSEKCDPFLDEMKTALLKNKPADIAEYLIAFCEAKLAGNPVPETHKGHGGGTSNSTKMLIKVQSPAAAPVHSREGGSRQTHRTGDGATESSETPQRGGIQYQKPGTAFDDSRAITPVV
jgi:hypothetical protein